MTIYSSMYDHIEKCKGCSKKNTMALLAVTKLHQAQEITLPNGEWGNNCFHCDGFNYPCKTVATIIEVLQNG
jgi:hypothetical protein